MDDDPRDELLRAIAGLCAIRHQIDGSKEEMAQRRADLLDCIAAKVAAYGSTVDVM